jgi:hypothetical protein
MNIDNNLSTDPSNLMDIFDNIDKHITSFQTVSNVATAYSESLTQHCNDLKVAIAAQCKVLVYYNEEIENEIDLIAETKTGKRATSFFTQLKAALQFKEKLLTEPNHKSDSKLFKWMGRAEICTKRAVWQVPILIKYRLRRDPMELYNFANIQSEGVVNYLKNASQDEICIDGKSEPEIRNLIMHELGNILIADISYDIANSLKEIEMYSHYKQRLAVCFPQLSRSGAFIYFNNIVGKYHLSGCNGLIQRLRSRLWYKKSLVHTISGIDSFGKKSFENRSNKQSFCKEFRSFKCMLRFLDLMKEYKLNNKMKPLSKKESRRLALLIAKERGFPLEVVFDDEDGLLQFLNFLDWDYNHRKVNSELGATFNNNSKNVFVKIGLHVAGFFCQMQVKLQEGIGFVFPMRFENNVDSNDGFLHDYFLFGGEKMKMQMCRSFAKRANNDYSQYDGDIETSGEFLFGMISAVCIDTNVRKYPKTKTGGCIPILSKIEHTLDNRYWFDRHIKRSQEAKFRGISAQLDLFVFSYRKNITNHNNYNIVESDRKQMSSHRMLLIISLHYKVSAHYCPLILNWLQARIVEMKRINNEADVYPPVTQSILQIDYDGNNDDNAISSNNVMVDNGDCAINILDVAFPYYNQEDDIFEDDRAGENAKQSDGDHCKGRDERYKNGIPFVYPTSHRMNTCRK